MKVTLIRHGAAEDRPVDALRPLSANGRRQVEELAQFIQSNELRPQRIIHSELLRARETAKILHDALSGFPHLEESPSLLPVSNPEEIVGELLVGDEDIFLVGHMPYMGLLAESLTGKPTGFITAGCLVLERNEDSTWKVIKTNQ